MHKITETGKLWQTVVLLITFLILIMISAIVMSTDTDETKEDISHGTDIPQGVKNDKGVFEKPLKILKSEGDYYVISFG